MSKLQELIQELCPDGVEYKKLGEVAKVTSGSSAPQTNSDFSKTGTPFCRTSDVGKVHLSVDFDNISDRITDSAAKKMTLMPKGTILIPKSGASTLLNHKVRLNIESYVVSHLAAVIPNKNEINDRYLYYTLTRFNMGELVEDKSYPSVKTSDIAEKIKIPIPPLPVQEEIVRILDDFTNLAAELQAELQARQEQYEYYRNKLLTFNKINGGGYASVTWMKMSEVFEIRNGYTPSKANPEFWKNGNIPWYRMEDIRQNGRILEDSILHITAKGVKGKGLFKANSFILATTATIGEHALIIADSLANQRFTNLEIRKSLEDRILIKYMYFYMFIVDNWCKENTNVSGFASVDMKKFHNLLIPIPPLAEQERIVSILDKFESLTSDLSQGLPAEIAAVQEQYEYYRDKLLSFPKSKISA